MSAELAGKADWEVLTENSKLSAQNSDDRQELDMEHRRSQSIVQEKSFRFAVQLIGYIRRQPKDPINLVLTRQLLRSGTSIGANVEEALRRKLTRSEEHTSELQSR